MSRLEEHARFPDVDVSRREALKALAGGGVAAGAAKAADNVLIGYGTLIGTNLTEQAESGDLASLADEGFGPTRGYRVSSGGQAVEVWPDRIRVRRDGGGRELAFGEATREAAANLDLPGPLSEFVIDVGAVGRGEHAFEFHRFDAFFDRIAGAEPRPLVTDALRRWPEAADPSLVSEFADADPADPRAVLRGLIDGFREHAYYDAPRYVAGSIEDNVLMGAIDLRSGFREPTGFESLLEPGGPGLFCYEFTHRSIEAVHAVPAHEQSHPVVGARVWDRRHKHVYTAVASVIRDDDGLRVPMTFVDYTHTTLYDDLGLRGLLGEGFEAYNPRHRAGVIHWSPYGPARAPRGSGAP